MAFDYDHQSLGLGDGVYLFRQASKYEHWSCNRFANIRNFDLRCWRRCLLCHPFKHRENGLGAEK